MLDPTQRARIFDGIPNILAGAEIKKFQSGQISREEGDYPVMIVSFLTEGNRQQFWRDPLHEHQDLQTKDWTTYYGQIAQATISVAIESTDLAELQVQVSDFMHQLWQTDWNWNADKLELRSTDPPRWMPAYPSAKKRLNIYRCVVDFFIDYEFSWPVVQPPITAFDINTTASQSPSSIQLYAIAPGCYMMTAIISGGRSAYRMSAKII